MTSDLENTLSSPVLQIGINLLSKSRPEIFVAIQIVSIFLSNLKKKDPTIQLLDEMAAKHVKRLVTEKLSVVEQHEIEIRLHELLTVLVKLGEV